MKPLLVLVTLVCAGFVALAGPAPPARAGTSPQALAREILGHAPRGLGGVIVERGFVRVAVDANYTPFSQIDSDTGKPVGFDVDYSRAVARRLGLHARLKFPAWGWVPRGLVEARHFEVSIGGLKNTVKHRRTLAFTRPYYHLAARVLVRKGGPQVTGVESLSGRRVGAQSSTYLRFLLNRTDARAVQILRREDLRRALLQKRISMWLCSAVDAQRLAVQDDRLEVSGPVLFWDRCAVATRKGEDDLIALLDHAVAALEKDGTTRALIDKWFGTEDPGIRP